MRIEFTDTEYRFEHGKAPRGYGMWGFQYGRTEDTMFWASGTLTEAKKACREYVKAKAPQDYIGTIHVNILP